LADIKGDIDRILYLSRRLKIDEGLCDGQLDMAQYYLWKDQIDKADNYADSALQIASRMNSNDLKRECFFMVSHIAYAGYQYKRAMQFDEQIDLTQEAINTASINRSLIELQTKYQTEKKTAQIRQLQARQQLQKLSIEKKRIYIGVLVVVLMALFIIGLLYYRSHERKQKLLLAEQQLQQQKIDVLEQEKLLLATEAVLKGQDEERNRLAKDLHDELGGILSSAKYSLSDMKENIIITPDNALAFERTMGILDKSISELRRVAHNMMPESLMRQTLSEALNDVCNQVSSSTAVSIDYRDYGMNEADIDSSTKVTVYRVVQELLNNIIKHALASNVIVQVIAKDGSLHVTVEDNGKGFDTALLESVEGIGYKNIRSRIDYLKGRIDIQSQAGKGTSVYIEIPI
jgi:signal transduction histidine kinase